MNDMGPKTAPGSDSQADRATPVMAQFLQVKAAHPGCLLFYRMGDFYELFFADAEIAARALGIALTRRGKHLGEDIPMCGVPVHAADGYLQRLIRLGHRVAVCEQLEDPAEARKRGSKAVVRRDVVRLVTPGTLTEDSLLDARTSNYLAALARVKSACDYALSWADISSGDLAVMKTAPGRLAADLARLGCREIVVSDSLLADADIGGVLDRAEIAVTPLPASRFDSLSAERRIREFFGVSALDAFGEFSRAEIASLGGLLEYVSLTQVGRLPHLRPPRREEPSASLLIDTATRTNLELMRTLAGDKAGSLLHTIDLTVTASGARLLAERLASPLADARAIDRRLDEVSGFAAAAELRASIRDRLSRMPDLERSLGRLTVGRGGPRDLAAIRDGLRCARELALLLGSGGALGGLPPNTGAQHQVLLGSDVDLADTLTAGLADALPLLARDGGFVRQGYHADLDENRALRDDTKQVIAELQLRYAEDTGIRALKIRHNNVLGYFIEVSSQNAAVLQAAERAGTFIHRQTVANAVRFVTTELLSLEQRIAAAADRAQAIELEIFTGLVSAVTSRGAEISRIAAAAAAVDVAAALAELAVRFRYCRPRIDQSTAFEVEAARHPVVEAVLRSSDGKSFVANDCSLTDDGHRLWLLTGPNMAGKSTFLRQNALMIVLAQMGSFVPAASAHVGVVDRLFSRVGAADDLARGRSTFMVEMVETAAILNQATPRSFVILDEIGRGTATYDGLSIAWAVVENLHEVNRCRALFATHYHELTVLASRLRHLSNHTVKVREWQGEVIFLHEVAAGVADRSYGIQVARLAGLPPEVIARASQVLDKLEGNDRPAKLHVVIDDLPLFSAAVRTPPPKAASAVESRLSSVNPDDISPREAHLMLYELKQLLGTGQ